MKYLTIIALSFILFSCENKGKKVVKDVVEAEEATEDKVDNVMIKGTLYSAGDSTAISMGMILVPGTTIATMSGGDGKFGINVPEGTKKLVFVMEGHEKAEVEIMTDKENAIYLKPKK